MSQQLSQNDDSSEWCDSFSFQDDSINVTLVTEHNLICRDQGWFSNCVSPLIGWSRIESESTWKHSKVKRESIFAVGNIGLAIGSFIGGSITGTVLIGWSTYCFMNYRYFIGQKLRKSSNIFKDILGRKNVMFFITAISVISLGIQSVSPNLWTFTIFWTIAKICSQVKYLAYSRLVSRAPSNERHSHRKTSQ